MRIINKSARSFRMNQIFLSVSRSGLALLAGILALPAWASDIIALDVASLPGDKTEIKVSFNEPITAPQSYTIDQPARIAIDLDGVKNRLGERNRDLGAGNARSITLVEAGDRTRMIVNLTNLVPYSTRVEGNNLFVLVGENNVASSLPPASPAVPPAKANQTAAARPRSSKKLINNIDFQRGEQGEGNVIIELSDSSVNPDIREQGNKIRLNFAGTELPEALRARLDVKDFATPVQYVAASGSPAGSSIVIEPTGNYEYMVYQANNLLTVSIKPQSKEERQRADVPQYKGEKLSLNFQDIEVRSVLQLIADFTELNLVASDAVQGNITLRLQNVPWDQALDLVLRTKGLDKRLIGNVLMVDLAEGIAARERQELESRKQIAELAPLYRERIQVNYAKADKIVELFKATANTGNTSSKGDDRGTITHDERTNSIIAYQTQDKLDELRRIISELDVPVKQVMIEARLVEANETFGKELGVKWSGSFKSGGYAGGNTRSTIGGGTIGGSPNTFVDLGATAASSAMAFGYIKDNILLNLELSAMQRSGHGEIISQPKVMVANQQTAKVMKGEEIPYQESSGGASGSTTTSFKEAVLSLEVTPQITPDNKISMEVRVNKDRADFTNKVNGVPPILKQEVSASIIVPDGETVVIGGVFEGEKTKSVAKVPFLGDLPFIGGLFRRNSVTDEKRELLIFITPRILSEHGVSVTALP